MPRMDGITLSRTLANERPGIACVIMSGQVPESDLPMDTAFLAKPFTEDVLILRVRQGLRKTQLQDAATITPSGRADVA